MRVIGLTGGIGTGKGEVADALRSLGAQVIDADKAGHDVYLPGTEGWQRVVSLFGRDILDSKGGIDRGKLGSLVFADEQARSRLNEALHPLIREAIQSRLEELRRQDVPVVIVEAALLFEAGWRDMTDEVWTVSAPIEAVSERLQRGRGLSPQEVVQRVEAQSTDEWRRQQADVVIDNSGGLDDLRRQVQYLWEQRITGKW
jgi:dephospho-CoA kinase